MNTQDTRQEAECFLLKSQAGHWIFQVHVDGQEVGGGGGFDDKWDAYEEAQDRFPHYNLKVVVTKDEQ